MCNSVVDDKSESFKMNKIRATEKVRFIRLIFLIVYKVMLNELVLHLVRRHHWLCACAWRDRLRGCWREVVAPSAAHSSQCPRTAQPATQSLHCQSINQSINGSDSGVTGRTHVRTHDLWNLTFLMYLLFFSKRARIKDWLNFDKQTKLAGLYSSLTIDAFSDFSEI